MASKLTTFRSGGLLALSLASGAHAALYDVAIETAKGLVQGYPAFNSSPKVNLSNWQDVTVWKGIPFAATTGGPNRFKPPQPVKAWNSTLLAKSPGNVCPSTLSDTTGYNVDEDCLNLKIWSAAESANAKLPVVLWTYPADSTAADSLFDGAGMADKGVVFVNYNYRTGSFGWLAHPELSAEFSAVTGSNSSGNWGLLDQFAALEWVRDNIDAFGGDPDHITIMGQSAGSAATYHMLNSPLTRGQFVGAIIESGVRDPRDPLADSLAEGYNTLEFSLTQGSEYLASLNVTSIAELRALDFEDLVTSSDTLGNDNSWTFRTTLDYYAMPDIYYNTLINGLASDVPILTGNARDESGVTWGLNITVEEYLEDLNTTYGAEWAEKFFALYPANDSTTASSQYNIEFTDRSKIGTWLWSRLWASNATSPVYTYLWDHEIPGYNAGAAHESEIPYVLNNLYGIENTWADEDYTIAETMNAYWVNFIKTGNPNGDNLTKWDASGNAKTTQELGGGWGSMAVASCSKLFLVESWFETFAAI